jgi:hypothetical protein
MTHYTSYGLAVDGFRCAATYAVLTVFRSDLLRTGSAEGRRKHYGQSNGCELHK